LFETGVCDANRSTEFDVSPLWAATYNQHLEVVKFLVGCEGIELDKRSHDGKTAFWIACSSGNLELVKCLFESGCDANQVDKNGVAPISNALNVEIVKYLNERGISVENNAYYCNLM